MNQLIPHITNALKFAGRISAGTLVAMATHTAVMVTADKINEWRRSEDDEKSSSRRRRRRRRS
jgi:hypothetical protein